MRERDLEGEDDGPPCPCLRVKDVENRDPLKKSLKSVRRKRKYFPKKVSTQLCGSLWFVLLRKCMVCPTIMYYVRKFMVCFAIAMQKCNCLAFLCNVSSFPPSLNCSTVEPLNKGHLRPAILSLVLFSEVTIIELSRRVLYQR